MSGHLRVVLIEADGDSATRAIEMALAAFAPQSVPAGAASVRHGAERPALAAPAVPAALPAPQPGRRPRKASKSRAAPHRAVGVNARQREAQHGAAAAEPSPAVSATGVTVDGNVVTHNGRSITVAPREAQFAAALARVMPSVADRKVLAQTIWGRVDDVTLAMVSQYAVKLNLSVEAIGLKVTVVRGIGVTMAPA